MAKVKANFWMPAELQKDLKALADEYGGNFSSYVNMVLTGHVKQEKSMDAVYELKQKEGERRAEFESNMAWMAESERKMKELNSKEVQKA